MINFIKYELGWKHVLMAFAAYCVVDGFVINPHTWSQPQDSDFNHVQYERMRGY